MLQQSDAEQNDIYNCNSYTNTAVVDIEDPNNLPPILQENGNIFAKKASDIVRIARKQFESGKTKNIEFRRQQLKNLLKMFQENTADLEKAVCQDLGKHRLESSAYDVEYAKNHARKMLMHLDEWNKSEKLTKPYANLFDEVTIQKEPYGIVLVLSPWNFPVNLLFAPVSGAIAAGNCVVIKPSEISTATAKIIAELVPKYLDNDCYPVYLGGADETTELLKQRFDYIFFTGSTTVGKIVYAAATQNLTPVTLELGGKSPVYIDHTANIEIATKRILWGKFMNAGQLCIAPDYILCTKDVQEKLVTCARRQLREWYGDDVSSSPYYARIINDKHFERLVSFLKGSNNKIVIGGKFDSTTRFIEPTILNNVNPNDPIMEDEIFGPILPTIVVQNVCEAISFINAREKPLALYVFTKNQHTKNLILRNTSSGGVCVNDTVMQFSVETLPFGGVGFSGMGSYHGKTTFDTFVHRKSIVEKGYSKIYEKLHFIRYPPYSDRNTTLLNMVTRSRRPLPITLLKYIFVFILGIAVSFIIQEIIKI